MCLVSFSFSVVRTIPVWDLVVPAVLQHEPGWESGSHMCHRALALLWLEEHPDHVGDSVRCLRICVSGFCEERPKGRRSAQH